MDYLGGSVWALLRGGVWAPFRGNVWNPLRGSERSTWGGVLIKVSLIKDELIIVVV